MAHGDQNQQRILHAWRKVPETSATLCDIAFSRPVSDQYCSAGTAGPIIERTYVAVPNYEELLGTSPKIEVKSMIFVRETGVGR